MRSSRVFRPHLYVPGKPESGRTKRKKTEQHSAGFHPSLVLPTKPEVLIPCLIRGLCARWAPPADIPKSCRDREPPTPRQAFDVGSCSANARRVGIFEVPDDRRDSGQRAGLSVCVDPRLLPPPVVIQGCLSGVAGLAQASQVRGVVGAAVLEREHVVNFLHRRVSPSL